jgi:hypothetical protein
MAALALLCCLAAAPPTGADVPAGPSPSTAPSDELPAETAPDDPLTQPHARELELTLPVSRQIGAGDVRVEAESTHVLILWNADLTAPTLNARWSTGAADRKVLVSAVGDDTTVRTVSDPAVEGYPILELRLVPGQNAAVVGSSLSLDAEMPEGATAPDGATTSLAIEAVQSDLSVVNVAPLDITGEDTVLFASGGSGAWTLDLSGGNAELVDHQGSTQLTGRQAEVVLEAIDGILSLDATDTEVLVRGGHARLDAFARGGSVECEETAGPLTVKGVSAAVTIRRVTAPAVAVSGEDLYVTLDDGAGRAIVTMTRGNLEAVDWSTRLDLTVRDGASAGVRDLDGDLAFSALSGASLEITGVTGHVRGRAFDATLRASSLKSIDLQARGADVRVENTLNLTAMSLTDTTSYLNLSELRGERSISLDGRSSATIELGSPCQVRVRGPGAARSSRISVSGCDSVRPGQPWMRTQIKRQGFDTPDPIRLSVELGAEADVVVTGY